MKHMLQKVMTKRCLVFSLAALLLYTLCGFIVAPLIVRWFAPRYVQQNLHCHLDFDKIQINPFLLTLEIDHLHLDQENGSPLAAIARLFVDMGAESIYRRALVLQGVNLEKPELHLVIESDGAINLARLSTAPRQGAGTETSDSELLPFFFHNAVIQDGRVSIFDKRQSIPAKLTLQGLNLRLLNLSSLKDHTGGSGRIEAATPEGESMRWEGEIALAPFQSTGKFTFNSVRLASLWNFFRDSTNLEPPTGLINLSTGYQVAVDKTPIQLILENLSASVSDFSLQLLNSEKPFLQLKQLDWISSRYDLGKKELSIGQMFVRGGSVNDRIDETNSINLQKVFKPSLPENDVKTAYSPTKPEPPFKVQAESVEVKDVVVRFDDNRQTTPIKTAVKNVDLHLQAEMKFDKAANDIVLHGITSELTEISLFTDSSAEPLFAMEKMNIDGGKYDLAVRAFSIDTLALRKGLVDTRREKDGTFNLRNLFLIQRNDEKSLKQETLPTTVPEWNFLIKSFALDDFNVKFTDQTTSSREPVLSLQGINANVTGIDGKSPMAFSLALQMEQGGTATANGIISPAIPSVEADLKADEVVLTSLQPYIEPYVILKLRSGAASVQGHLRYGIPGDKQQTSFEGNLDLSGFDFVEPGAKKSYLSWKKTQLSACRLTLQPTRLDIRAVNIYKPVGELIVEKDKTLNIARVIKKRSADPAAKVSSPSPAKPHGPDVKGGFPFQIARIQVQDGDVVFADLSLRPSFKTRIHDLKGSITGLSSLETSQATVKMDGHIDKYGTAQIKGAILPYDFGGSSELSMIFRNVEMSVLSPYSGKFAGRLIQSGKLSADLQYTLKDHLMTGENKIVLDNLLLGDEVDAPGAADLPLSLALALLRDADGRINLGLPVTGDLNDPQFSIGPLILKVFTNLIFKTATAPFMALGSLLGGDTEKFDKVLFDPGDSELPPPEKEKLFTLAEALKNRSQLRLTIQGRYSLEFDGLELRERAIRRIVSTRLGVQLEQDAIPEQLDFFDSSTQNILEKLYRERFGKSTMKELEKGLAAGTITPQNDRLKETKNSKEAGMLSNLVDNLHLYKIIPGGKSREQAEAWAQELYNRLVADEKIDDRSLLELADNRARAIATHLADETQISQERIIIQSPESLGKDDGPPSVRLGLEAH